MNVKKYIERLLLSYLKLDRISVIHETSEQVLIYIRKARILFSIAFPG